jgi:malate/lactate dehydrogenase
MYLQGTHIGGIYHLATASIYVSSCLSVNSVQYELLHHLVFSIPIILGRRGVYYVVYGG